MPIPVKALALKESGNEGLAFVLNLIERRRAEERLRELESDLAYMNRLSVMGELAASLAHEIAQPIASARNNARAAQNFLDMKPPDLGEVREALTCVVGDVDRTGEIIERIRAHIKKAPTRQEHFDLNAAINGSLCWREAPSSGMASRSIPGLPTDRSRSTRIAFNCNKSSSTSS